jgi:hypothetical protein
MSAADLRIGTPIGRWVGIGPYYAMFPVDFAFKVVQEYSSPGQVVLDPFAGRASSIYAAAATGRRSLGIEINPVGWLYGQVKLHPAPKASVVHRLEDLVQAASGLHASDVAALPEFFRICFSPLVLRFLLAARACLRWRESVVDATIMAIILIYLHGKQGQALSNQMRQGKSMSPDYSVRWWRSRHLTPPEVDPHAFLLQRIEWRYAKGIPTLAPSSVVLGDSRLIMRELAAKVAAGEQRPFDLLFTSPPYHEVTNYHYDQWLRLWMLGGPARPVRLDGEDQKKFESRAAYRGLLMEVFGACSQVMSSDAKVYVRTDARPFTLQTTLEVLRNAFPSKALETVPQPYQRSTQTALFGDKAEKPGEIDIILW